MAAASAYHGGRVLAYTVAGLGLGALGGSLGAATGALHQVGAWLAFVLALVLVLAAFGVAGRLNLKMPGFVQQAFRGVGRFPAVPRAGAVGLLTALLPCGLLFAVYALALTSGSAFAGAGVLLGFALGSLPLLALAQWRWQGWRARLGDRRMAWIQRAMLLLAAGLLVWRGVLDLLGDSCCA